MAELTLEQANGIIEAAIGKAREMGIPPLGVVVLDAGGHMKAMQREDGATMFRGDVAKGKAWAAVRWGSRAAGSRTARKTIRIFS